MCVEEAISKLRIESRNAASVSQTVILPPCACGLTRCDVPTPPTCWSSKHASIQRSIVGGQIASSSAKTMRSVVVWRMPWAICSRLFALGTVSTSIRSASTEAASARSAGAIEASVTMRILCGSDCSHEYAACWNSGPASIVGTMIVTSSCAAYVGCRGGGIGR